MSLLTQSAALLRRAPLLALAYGLGLTVSVAATPCLVGIVAGPSLAVLFSLRLDRRPGPETFRPWLAAAGLYFVGGLVVSACLVPALLLAELGAEALASDHASLTSWAPFFAASAALPLAAWVLAPFAALPVSVLHSPAPTKPARSFVAVAVALYVAAMPWVFAVALSRSEAWVLSAVALALAPVTTPFASAILVTIAKEAGEDTAARGVAWGRPVGAALSALAVLGLFGVCAAEPPEPLRGAAPPHGRQLVELALGDTASLPGTDLVVSLEVNELRVAAWDGGGAGRISLPEPVTKGRVFGANGVFVATVELAEGETRVVPFDPQGVRLDDNLARRVQSHLPWWGWALCFGLLLLVPLPGYLRDAKDRQGEEERRQ